MLLRLRFRQKPCGPQPRPAKGAARHSNLPVSTLYFAGCDPKYNRIPRQLRLENALWYDTSRFVCIAVPSRSQWRARDIAQASAAPWVRPDTVARATAFYCGHESARVPSGALRPARTENHPQLLRHQTAVRQLSCLALGQEPTQLGQHHHRTSRYGSHQGTQRHGTSLRL